MDTFLFCFCQGCPPIQPASASPSITRVLCIQLLLRMVLTPRFPLPIRILISFLRKRWDQSTRLLCYIFVFVRSRIFSQSPKKRDEIGRGVEYRPANATTTAICASRFPPPLTTNPAAYHPDPEPIHAVLSPHGEGHASSLISSRPPSLYSHRPISQYSVYRPPSQYSHHSGAPQYPRCSSPILSIRPPSIAASGASLVYRAPRPTYQVRRLPQTRGVPQRRVRFSTIHSLSTTASLGPGPALSAFPGGRLRPMIGIDRYEKANKVVIEDKIHSYVFHPVTTEFMR